MLEDLQKAKFTKISYNPKAERFRAELIIDDGEKGPTEAMISVPGTPSDEVIAALADLRQDIVSLCELTDVKLDSLEVRNVNMKHDKAGMGLTMHAVRTLARSSSPLNLHTPYKVNETSPEGGDPNRHLEPGTVTRVRTLVRESIAFLQGGGPQMDAFRDQTPTRRPAEAEPAAETSQDPAQLDITNEGEKQEVVFDGGTSTVVLPLREWVDANMASFTAPDREKITTQLQGCNSWESFQAIAKTFGFRPKSADYRALGRLLVEQTSDAQEPENVDEGLLATV